MILHAELVKNLHQRMWPISSQLWWRHRLSAKCCPCSLSVISPNKWKSDSAKSRLYSVCGRTVQQVSWQTCIRWSLHYCVSIHGTHLAQILWYSNVANIVSNTLNPTFSSVQSSPVVIHWFGQMSWSRHSSFHKLTAVQGHSEHGLSLTSLTPLL
jgi:hypothetical protein